MTMANRTFVRSVIAVALAEVLMMGSAMAVGTDAKNTLIAERFMAVTRLRGPCVRKARPFPSSPSRPMRTPASTNVAPKRAWMPCSSDPSCWIRSTASCANSLTEWSSRTARPSCPWTWPTAHCRRKFTHSCSKPCDSPWRQWARHWTRAICKACAIICMRYVDRSP